MCLKDVTIVSQAWPCLEWLYVVALYQKSSWEEEVGRSRVLTTSVSLQNPRAQTPFGLVVSMPPSQGCC